MGYREYERLAAQYHVPFVVGGFEPVDLLEAISMRSVSRSRKRSRLAGT